MKKGLLVYSGCEWEKECPMFRKGLRIEISIEGEDKDDAENSDEEGSELQ